MSDYRLECRPVDGPLWHPLRKRSGGLIKRHLHLWTVRALSFRMGYKYRIAEGRTP